MLSDAVDELRALDSQRKRILMSMFILRCGADTPARGRDRTKRERKDPRIDRGAKIDGGDVLPQKCEQPADHRPRQHHAGEPAGQ